MTRLPALWWSFVFAWIVMRSAVFAFSIWFGNSEMIEALWRLDGPLSAVLLTSAAVWKAFNE